MHSFYDFESWAGFVGAADLGLNSNMLHISCDASSAIKRSKCVKLSLAIGGKKGTETAKYNSLLPDATAFGWQRPRIERVVSFDPLAILGLYSVLSFAGIIGTNGERERERESTLFVQFYTYKCLFMISWTPCHAMPCHALPNQSLKRRSHHLAYTSFHATLINPIFSRCLQKHQTRTNDTQRKQHRAPAHNLVHAQAPTDRLPTTRPVIRYIVVRSSDLEHAPIHIAVIVIIHIQELGRVIPRRIALLRIRRQAAELRQIRVRDVEQWDIGNEDGVAEKIDVVVEIVVYHVEPVLCVGGRQIRRALRGTRERAVGWVEGRLPHLGELV